MRRPERTQNHRARALLKSIAAGIDRSHCRPVGRNVEFFSRITPDDFNELVALEASTKSQ